MEKIFKYIDMENPFAAIEHTIIGFIGGSLFLMSDNNPILGSVGGSMMVSVLLAVCSYFGQKAAKKLDKFLEARWKLYKTKIKKKL